MQETIQGAQAKVDKHAAGPHPTATAGKPGGVLPAGTNGYALVFNSTTGVWEPVAIAGSGVAAAKADPQNLGFPATMDLRQISSAATVGTANRTHYHRVTGGGTITKIGIYIGAWSGNICVSVYASTGTGRASMPGARVATTGSIPCPASNYAEVPLGTSLNIASGDFWFAISADNTTATFGSAGSGTQNIQGVAAWQDSAFPSPATATPVNGGGTGGSGRWFGLAGVA